MKLHDLDKNGKPVIEQTLTEAANAEMDPQIKAALSFMGLEDPSDPEYKSHYASLKALKKHDPATFKLAISLD